MSWQRASGALPGNMGGWISRQPGPEPPVFWKRPGGLVGVGSDNAGRDGALDGRNELERSLGVRKRGGPDGGWHQQRTGLESPVRPACPSRI